MISEERRSGVDLKAKFLLALGAFFVLILMIFLLIRLFSTQTQNNSPHEQVSKTDADSEEKYLTDYYQDKRYGDDGDNYLENDPFAKTCEGVPKGAVFFGGTTCLR